jgi:hypothetical protein
MYRFVQPTAEELAAYEKSREKSIADIGEPVESPIIYKGMQAIGVCWAVYVEGQVDPIFRSPSVTAAGLVLFQKFSVDRERKYHIAPLVEEGEWVVDAEAKKGQTP